MSGLLFGPTAEPLKIDEVSSGAIGAYLLAAAALVIASVHDPAALAIFTILTAATVAIAWRADAALWALPAAGLMTFLVMLHWAVPTIFDQLVLAPGVTRGAIPGPSTGTELHLTLGLAMTALFGVTGYAVQGRSENPLIALLWSITAVATPIAILIALYVRIAEFDRSIPFAGLALLLAALYGYATELLSKRQPRPGLATAAAIFAAGAVAALALALTFALDKGWLTVALALMVPGIAWISERRPLPALRYLAAAVIVLVLLRVGYEPRIVGDDVGTTPIFNWLLYGYGVPAASFWYAGYLLRRRVDDGPARMADAAAIMFTVLLVQLEIRHYMNNGNIYGHSSSLAEVAMQVSVGLAMTIGLERLRLRTHSIVHDIGALIIGALTLAAIVLGLLLRFNPLLTGRPVGGTFFNLVLLGYGIPAVLAAILALIARDSRSLVLSRDRRSGRRRSGVDVSRAGSANAVSRCGSHTWCDQRCGAIHLFCGVAHFRRAASGRGIPAALAASTPGIGRGGGAHHCQGLPRRHGGADRNFPRAFVHRAWRGASRNWLALPAHVVSGERRSDSQQARAQLVIKKAT